MTNKYARARAALQAATQHIASTHAHAATTQQITTIQQLISDSNATDAQLDALADRLTRDLLVDGQQLIAAPDYLNTVTISRQAANIIIEALRALG